MKTRDTTPTRFLLAASVLLLGTGLLLLPNRSRQEQVVNKRQEIPARSYIALHDGFLYYQSQGKPGDEALYLYRSPLVGGRAAFFAQLPSKPVRSPAEYSLPPNEYLTSAAGLHYVEYKIALPAKAFLSEAEKQRFLNDTGAARAWYARVHTYPWDGSKPIVTSVPANGGRVSVLRVTPEQVLYQERAPISRLSAIEAASTMHRNLVKTIPLHGGVPSKVSPGLLSPSRGDVVLWDVPVNLLSHNTRPALAPSDTTDAVRPEQMESGLWWIQKSDDKLCHIAPGETRVQAVELPIQTSELESIHYLWLRRVKDRVYLRCDVTATHGDRDSAASTRSYLLHLPAGKVSGSATWGTPTLLSEAMTHANNVFLEDEGAYFICHEKSRNTATRLQSLFATDPRESLVGALYRVPLPY